MEPQCNHTFYLIPTFFINNFVMEVVNLDIWNVLPVLRVYLVKETKVNIMSQG